MKTATGISRVTNWLNRFWLAAFILALSPRISAEITLVSRLSDAQAYAQVPLATDSPPPQTQTDFLPANLTNSAKASGGGSVAGANTGSVSAIVLDNAMGTLQVTGSGSASTETMLYLAQASGSAKVIVLTFALSDIAYAYSLTGGLTKTTNCGCAYSDATVTLAQGESTIFQARKAGNFFNTGTLLPGTYTVSVDVQTHNLFGSNTGSYTSLSGANFTFALHPAPTGPPTERFLNLSTRFHLLDADEPGIGGFIITGTSPKRLIVRGIGPSLTQLGIPDALINPTLTLSTTPDTSVNDDWKWDNNTSTSQEAEIRATGIPPTNDLESAILATLPPRPYTVILNGWNGATGVALVEIYDLDASLGESKLANISTRAFVGTGTDVVIGGFILGGDTNTNVVLRGIGPSLSNFGVVNALPDPTLELRDGDGALVMGNDNWQDDPAQAAIISQVGLGPTNTLESAIAVTLWPGNYTVILAGVNSRTGVGLVEAYDLGPP